MYTAKSGCSPKKNWKQGSIFAFMSSLHTAMRLRPYFIAKSEGCKFYCGSDAHTGTELQNLRAWFERGIEDLGLTEDDKFIIK